MARLSKTEAARQLGIARSTLYKLIDQGKLSPTPDGLIDQAELVRVAAYADVVKGRSRTSADTHTIPAYVQAEDTHGRPQTGDRGQAETDVRGRPQTSSDVLVDILREQIQTLREELQEARQERQAARDREAVLLQMVQEMQHRYDRLLDMPRQAAQDAPPGPQPPSPVRSHQPRQAAVDAAYQRMVALQTEGLTLAQIAEQLTREGHRTRHGRPWHKSTVAYVLKTYGR
jgi:hypothetical protein